MVVSEVDETLVDEVVCEVEELLVEDTVAVLLEAEFSFPSVEPHPANKNTEKRPTTKYLLLFIMIPPK